MLIMEKRGSVYCISKEGVSRYSLKRRSLSIFHKEKRISFYILYREGNLSLYSPQRGESLSVLFMKKLSLYPIYIRKILSIFPKEKRFPISSVQRREFSLQRRQSLSNLSIRMEPLYNISKEEVYRFSEQRRTSSRSSL